MWRSTKFDMLELSGVRYAPYSDAQAKELKKVALQGGILPRGATKALKLAFFFAIFASLVGVKKVRVTVAGFVATQLGAMAKFIGGFAS